MDKYKCPFCGNKGTWVKFTDETHEFGPKHYRYVVTGLSGEKCLSCGEAVYNTESNHNVISAINLAHKIIRGIE